MKTLAIAFAAIALTAQAQYGPRENTYAVGGITVPKRGPTMLDWETANFQRFREDASKIGGAIPQMYLDYWQKRMELAAQVDAGSLSPDGWSATRKIQDEMIRAQGEANAKRAEAAIADLQA